MTLPVVALAQRANEDVIAEALNAFGTTVGRQSIGLYSANSARGFSPQQAGNLRIDGLYFNQGASQGLPDLIVRSSSVSVGITALAYPFAAPTGVVDYELRVPGQKAVLSNLIGDASYGQAYDELTAELPIISSGVLSMGAGVGYERNDNFDGANDTRQWTGAWIARWQPTDNVQVTPFWDVINERDYGEKPQEFIDDDGIPRYFPISKVGQSWANFYSLSSNFGAIVRVSWPRQWQLSAGLFRSLQYYPPNVVEAAVSGLNDLNQGDYLLTAFPPNSSGATSGEIRLSKSFGTSALRSQVYARLAIRDSNTESASGDTKNLGLVTITAIPQFPEPAFNPGPLTDVRVQEYTPSIAYEGDLNGRARLILSAQKVLYHRTATVPGAPPVSSSSSPILYHGALAVSVTRKFLAYGSYTQGFEEIGNAPLNAVNRNEPAPAQSSLQIDGGLEYQLRANLQLIGGAFSIEKPYFSVDRFDVYRKLGQMRNTGLELSLAGNLTRQLHVVSGVALIRPQVDYQAGLVSGPTHAVAVGPVPGYWTTALEYHLAQVKGLILGAQVNTYSSRYAVYPTTNLPPVNIVNAEIRYQRPLFGYNATVLFQAYNVTDAFMVEPDPTRQINMGDARRYELSLEMDF